MAGGLRLVGWLVVVATVLMGGATAVTHTVGGSLEWKIPPNTTAYSTWADNETFAVGDTLVFAWTDSHTVANVSSSDFNSCNSNQPNAIQTSPFNFNLSSNETYYFICTVGTHCSLGQKVAITVGGVKSGGAPPPPTTAGAPPPPTAAGAPPPLTTAGALSAVLVALALSFMTLM